MLIVRWTCEMKWLVLTLVLIEISLGAVAEASVIEFNLPQLVGPYTPDFNVREDTVTYVGPSIAVGSISIHLRGTAQLGLLQCCGPWTDCPDTTNWDLDATAAIWHADNPEFLIGGASIRDQGTFEIEIKFQSLEHLDSLKTGDRLAINQYISAVSFFLWPCYGITAPSEGIVEDARLVVVEADASLPTKHTTWGRIKSLFER